MVTSRRFLPLILIVIGGMLGLMVRLYQVQVVEHKVWAKEAANLVRESRTIPYLRGKILDRSGQVLVQDEGAFAVRFIYRKFRRDHPLGQVAHARSVLENRSVELQTTALNLVEWGSALIDSKAGDLQAFAEGEAVELCGFSYPEVKPGEDRRRTRAGELRFYASRLLDVSSKRWNGIKKKLKNDEGLELTWFELVAKAEDIEAEEVRARAVRRMEMSLQRLQQLAVQMNVKSVTGQYALSGEESMWFLIDGLELKRREIEGAIAKDLFKDAAGFDPGRIESDVLLGLFNLDFLSEDLGWTPGRRRCATSG
jgi:cell division protein FtsI/penicillin-binding protein 2